MKSDILIKDDLSGFIKGSRLATSVTGKVCKTSVRPKDSDKEDVVISVVTNMNGQIQEAVVNVNIYVKDDYIKTTGQYQEATIRLRELCSIASETLEVGNGNDFRFTLESQKVLAVETNEHVINNRLIYKQVNE